MNNPQTINEITPCWMTDALRAGGSLKVAAVIRVELKQLGIGVGFLGGIAQVRLTYDRPEGGTPASVVVKLPAADEVNRALGDSVNAYEREVRFYQEIAPFTPIRVPRCHYSFMDRATGTYILVMEDLSKLTPGDQVAGLTRTQALACTDTIAALHATWWGGAKRSSLAWVPTAAKQLAELNVTVEHYRRVWPEFVAEFGRFAPTAGLVLGERLVSHLDHMLGCYATAPPTIVHVDYREDNLMLDDRSTDAPVVVLDWQLAAWGGGAYDVARLACGSLPPAERGGHHEEIVQRWHTKLLAYGVTGYSLNQAWHDYRVGALLAMVNPVLFHHMFKTGGKRGLELGAVMTERLFNAVLECGAESGEIWPE
jgi:aminoglycoside phosphotransferase (APT) family kinase protein